MRLIFVRRSISAKVLRSTAGTIKTCVTPYPASISARHWAPVIFAIVAPYLMASGLVGDPTAPVIGIAGATNRNSYTLSAAQSSASSFT